MRQSSNNCKVNITIVNGLATILVAAHPQEASIPPFPSLKCSISDTIQMVNVR